MPLYSRISWTAIPIGAPPRQIPTRKVGLKPLRTTCRPSSIESRNSESAEMKILSKGPNGIVVLRTQCILLMATVADHTTRIFLLFAYRREAALVRAKLAFERHRQSTIFNGTGARDRAQLKRVSSIMRRMDYPGVVVNGVEDSKGNCFGVRNWWPMSYDPITELTYSGHLAPPAPSIVGRLQNSW